MIYDMPDITSFPSYEKSSKWTYPNNAKCPDIVQIYYVTHIGLKDDAGLVMMAWK